MTKLNRKTLYMQNTKVLVMQILVIQGGGCTCRVGGRGDQRKGKHLPSGCDGHKHKRIEQNFFMFTLKNSVTMSLAKVNLVSLPCLELKHIVSCTGRFLPKKITWENQFQVLYIIPKVCTVGVW